METVRTRWAPSPTGYAHLGFLSRVLINYAMAKKNNGQFIWRNEDTDQERFVPDALEYNMRWMREYGLDWDEGPDKGGPYAPYNQTERISLYRDAYNKLIDNGYAYKCYCTKERLDELRTFQSESGMQTKYDGRCRNLSKDEISSNDANKVPFTVRIKMPKNKLIEFTDAITKNHIVWNSNDVDDYIIVKSNGIPTYHLAAMCDDIAMKITHAFRGSEWIASTPVHMMVYEGLGVKPEDRPKIGHFTVILDPNTPGKKMSKRNNSFRINGMLVKGYLKEAVLNYLMLLGWAPKDNRELFTLDEFVQAFDLNGMQKGNPTWDQKKMDWFNGQYIRKLSAEEFINRFFEWVEKFLFSKDGLALLAQHEEANKKEYSSLANLLNNNKGEKLSKVNTAILLTQERAINFWDVFTQLHLIYTAPTTINWEIEQVAAYKDKLSDIKKDLFEVMSSLDDDSSKWIQEDWVSKMREINQKYGLKGGDSFMVLRMCIVGSPFSPPLFEAMQLMPKQEILNRISK